MNMKIATPLLLAGLLSSFSTVSQAENSIYAGLAAGVSAYDYDDVDAGSATKLFVGYKIDTNLAIEATFYDSGDADITSLPGLALNSDGLNVTAFYRANTSGNDLVAMIGGGIYNFDTTIKGPGGSISESSSGLSLAAGLELGLTENLALRADIDMFFGVKDFADNGNVDSIHIGVVLNF